MKFSDLIPMDEPADSLSVIYGAVMFAVDFCKHFGLNYDLLRLTFEDLPADLYGEFFVTGANIPCLIIDPTKHRDGHAIVSTMEHELRHYWQWTYLPEQWQWWADYDVDHNGAFYSTVHNPIEYDARRYSGQNHGEKRDRHITVTQLRAECARERQYVMSAEKEVM